MRFKRLATFFLLCLFLIGSTHTLSAGCFSSIYNRLLKMVSIAIKTPIKTSPVGIQSLQFIQSNQQSTAKSQEQNRSADQVSAPSDLPGYMRVCNEYNDHPVTIFLKDMLSGSFISIGIQSGMNSLIENASTNNVTVPVLTLILPIITLSTMHAIVNLSLNKCMIPKMKSVHPYVYRSISCLSHIACHSLYFKNIIGAIYGAAGSAFSCLIAQKAIEKFEHKTGYNIPVFITWPAIEIMRILGSIGGSFFGYEINQLISHHINVSSVEQCHDRLSSHLKSHTCDSKSGIDIQNSVVELSQIIEHPVQQYSLLSNNVNSTGIVHFEQSALLNNETDWHYEGLKQPIDSVLDINSYQTRLSMITTQESDFYADTASIIQYEQQHSFDNYERTTITITSNIFEVIGTKMSYEKNLYDVRNFDSISNIEYKLNSDKPIILSDDHYNNILKNIALIGTILTPIGVLINHLLQLRYMKNVSTLFQNTEEDACVRMQKIQINRNQNIRLDSLKASHDLIICDRYGHLISCILLGIHYYHEIDEQFSDLDWLPNKIFCISSIEDLTNFSDNTISIAEFKSRFLQNHQPGALEQPFIRIPI
ncbi:MAG: hypothetical protein HAW62_00975 [Endozoicomonadaceae bacterium]|nr:hypothetical protein [Endozoicomonadaceae bacterium]